jgi:hypothetical protein
LAGYAPRSHRILDVTTRQRLHELVDKLSDDEVESLAQLILARRVHDDHREPPETVDLPEAWRTFDDGSPAPNWVEVIDEVRAGR